MVGSGRDPPATKRRKMCSQCVVIEKEKRIKIFGAMLLVGLVLGCVVGQPTLVAQSEGCGLKWAHAGKTYETVVEVPVRKGVYYV